MVTRAIVGGGTPEAEWQRWLPQLPVPPLDLAPLVAAARVVVLAAHPDDEVLGVGGLLAGLVRVGVRPVFVWASDGEGSHPDAGADLRRRLPGLRRAESAAAITRLGAPGAESHHLALPDTELEAHEGDIAAALGALVGEGDVLLAPWAQDGHPDHEACGRAAREVALRRGLLLLEYPVWLWHWSNPADVRVPWTGLRRHDLGRDVRVAKRAAVSQFVTQLTPAAGPGSEPVLAPAVLAHFDRAVEMVFT